MSRIALAFGAAMAIRAAMDVIEFYSATKNNLGLLLGADEDTLHVHAGLLIFFLTALLLQRRMRSWIPVSLVWLFAMANELIDYLAPGGSEYRWEPVVDVANTVFWPTLLFLLARRKVASQR